MWWLAMLGTAGAAEVWTSDAGALDVAGHAKTFALASFPYALEGVEQEPVGQGIVDGRLQLEWRSQRFDIIAHHAITTIAPNSSGGLGGATGAQSGVGAQASEAVDMTWVPEDGDGLRVQGRQDRLMAKVKLGRVSAAIGRQPVTFGRSYIFTPLDLINPFTPAVIDQEFKPGVDALRVDATAGVSTTATAVVAYAGGWDLDGLVGALYGQTTLGVWDLGLFAGLVRNEPVVGLSSAGSIGPVGLHAEGTVTVPDEGDPFVRGAVGGNTVANNTNLTLELYGQTIGAQSPGGLLTFAMSERVSRGEIWTLGRVYAAGAVAQQITPLTTVSAFALANLGDGSAMVGPSLGWSLAENAELALGAYLGVGSRPELDGLSLEVNSEYGLIPTTAFLQTRAYF